MKDIPFIQGTDIYLRELRECDLEGPWHGWFNDSETTRFQNKKVFPNTREKQRAYYDSLKASSSDVVLAIVESATGKHVGNVGLHHIDWIHSSAELGIVIGDKSARGKGYGRQCWKLITDYGFETLNLHRVYATILSENVASRKCAEAAGFKKEGEISEAFYKNGKYHNAAYYNALRDK